MKQLRCVAIKFAPLACLGAFVLAGCEHQMTLEEARAACTKQGGFLVVFYSQKVTLAGLGPEIATPGNCVSASQFDKSSAPAPAASSAPAPASPPPASGP